jgi:hypothetical protein
VHDVLHAHYRANASYQLILFDRLPEPQREQLRGLQESPDFYGFLWAQPDEGLATKSVDQQTALLFLTLQQPGPLPAYVPRRLGDGCAQAMADLVLDGVLQIALDAGGPFVSGAAAYGLLYGSKPAPEANGRIAQLSLEALRYAQELPFTDAAMLSARLYTYNTIPASPGWRRRLPTPDAVFRFLGLNESAVRAALAHSWDTTSSQQTGWLSWQSRSPDHGAHPPAAYKLYVSPVPDALPETFLAIVSALAGPGVISFKAGRDVYGLLRPDKIVAYCTDFDALAAAAARVREALPGCPAQGVPFTADILSSGLCSWGTDPPSNGSERNPYTGESWRLWLTNRLAVSLLAARTAASGMEPWQFALARLSLEGVDTGTWVPRQGIWQAQRSM